MRPDFIAFSVPVIAEGLGNASATASISIPRERYLLGNRRPSRRAQQIEGAGSRAGVQPDALGADEHEIKRIALPCKT
jgi:hypothetical protein